MTKAKKGGFRRPTRRAAKPPQQSAAMLNWRKQVNDRLMEIEIESLTMKATIGDLLRMTGRLEEEEE